MTTEKRTRETLLIAAAGGHARLLASKMHIALSRCPTWFDISYCCKLG